MTTSPEALAKQLQAVAEEYPIGAQVWHRGSGCRGIVIGYAARAHGILIDVSYSPTCVEPDNPIVLSSRPVKAPAFLDDEEWQTE